MDTATSKVQKLAQFLSTRRFKNKDDFIEFVRN